MVTPRRKPRPGEYIPAIPTPSFSSEGVRSRVWGRKSKRIHHLLSGLETHYFLCLDHSPRVTNIREQFSLDVDLTMDCAQRLKLRHPTDNTTNQPRAMTTDFVFLLEGQDGTSTTVARSTKYLAKLCETRVQELAAIEHLKWHDEKIDFGIVTERCVDPAVVRNAQWLGINSFDNNVPPVHGELLSKIESVLFSQLGTGMTLGEACRVSDCATNAKEGDSLGCLRYFLNMDVWSINICSPITIEEPLVVTPRPGALGHD